MPRLPGQRLPAIHQARILLSPSLPTPRLPRLHTNQNAPRMPATFGASQGVNRPALAPGASLCPDSTTPRIATIAPAPAAAKETVDTSPIVLPACRSSGMLLGQPSPPRQALLIEDSFEMANKPVTVPAITPAPARPIPA